MTDRQVYGAFLVVVVCIFAMLAWSTGAWQREADARHRAESTLEHVVRSCQQRADGSAVCPVGTFTEITTTVVGK